MAKKWYRVKTGKGVIGIFCIRSSKGFYMNGEKEIRSISQRSETREQKKES